MHETMKIRYGCLEKRAKACCAMIMVGMAYKKVIPAISVVTKSSRHTKKNTNPVYSIDFCVSAHHIKKNKVRLNVNCA